MNTRKWGPWLLVSEARTLVHEDGYAIPLREFRSADDYVAWERHIADKGWPRDYRTINGLNAAFTELNPDTKWDLPTGATA